MTNNPSNSISRVNHFRKFVAKKNMETDMIRKDEVANEYKTSTFIHQRRMSIKKSAITNAT